MDDEAPEPHHDTPQASHGQESFRHVELVLNLASLLPADMPITVTVPATPDGSSVEDVWITWAGFDKTADEEVGTSRLVIIAGWPAGNYEVSSPAAIV